MQLPKYHETFIPILEVLKNGEVIHVNEMRKTVRDKFYSDLSSELLSKRTKRGLNFEILTPATIRHNTFLTKKNI